MAQKSRAKPGTVDEYLAALTDDKRSALGKLRKAIQAAAPEAEEGISYGIPAFRLHGKPLIYFGAAANHCAIYAIPDHVCKKELARYESSGRGTIRFSPADPLPATLVRKLVKVLIAEMAANR